MRCFGFVILMLVVGGAGPVAAQSANTYWAQIEKLDSGPPARSGDPEEMKQLARQHLDRQQRLLTTFLDQFPRDERKIEAELKLAAVLAAKARVEKEPLLLQQAEALWNRIENDADARPKQKQAAAFSRVTTGWLTIDPATMKAERDRFLNEVRKFGLDHPSDERFAAMLAEISSLYPDQPEIQAAILREAQVVAQNPGLLARVKDDLLRLSFLGRPFRSSLPILAGPPLDSAKSGQPVLVVFWSPESVPSMELIVELKAILDEKPDWNYRVLAVAVTDRLDQAKSWFGKLDTSWTLAGEAGGWRAPAIRAWGINLLPTVWIVDAEGRVRHVTAQRELDAALHRHAE